MGKRLGEISAQILCIYIKCLIYNILSSRSLDWKDFDFLATIFLFQGMNTVEGIVMLASTNRPDILDQVRNKFRHKNCTTIASRQFGFWGCW